MADSSSRDKLAGILRIDTKQLQNDVIQANKILMNIGGDPKIASQIQSDISKAIIEGVQDGVKKANALGLKITVGVQGGSRGGGSGGGTQGGTSGTALQLDDVLSKSATVTQTLTKFSAEGEIVSNTIRAAIDASRQLTVTLNETGEVGSFSVRKITDNVTAAKESLSQMRSTVTDMKAAYQEWTNLAADPGASQNALDAARQKAEDLTARFRQLSADSRVFTEMGLQVSGFNSQIETGNRVIESFSEKLAQATNTASLKNYEEEQKALLRSYEDQARAIQAVGDAQAKVITSTGAQQEEAKRALEAREEERQKAEAVTEAILKQNSALEASKANLDGIALVTKANAEAAEKEAAARAKTNDQAKAQQQQAYNTALSQEKQILSNIHTIEKNLITAKGSEKTQLTEALNIEQQRLAGVQQKLNALGQELGLSSEEIANLRMALGIETQRTQNEAELLRLKRQTSVAGRIGDAISNIPTTMVNSLVFGATMAIARMPIQAIKEFWNNAWEYATTYYDKLNEIRVVTGKTAEEAEALGKNFRRMASELSVSSNEIAEAATIFYRQGLDDNAVNERLQATIQYAKTAGVEAENAANKITAVVNSIEKDGRGVEMTAQRVADVFLYLGDNAASSGEEIGTAMQRSAALADAAGVSFEMLGAYIATVSERTRQDAGTIGTALNAIMSRLTQVKNKGFNEEDETKVNDVAKALNSINVQLTDGEGHWRRIEDIFYDVAMQWDSLDDKTRNYLATIMAGTRQQNVFRTLMADLSGVTDGTSRAMELYKGAMKSAGTAAEKYAIYTDSVTAAHDRLTASMEKLYSLFNANFMKEIYNTGADIAEGIYGLFGGDQNHSYASAISVMTEQQNVISSTIEKYAKLKEELDGLTVGSVAYNKKAAEMEELVKSLAQQYAPFAEKVEQVKGHFSSADEAIEAMNDSLREQMELIRAYRAMDIGNDIVSAAESYHEAVGKLEIANKSSSVRKLFTSYGTALGYDMNSSLTEEQVRDIVERIKDEVKTASARELNAMLNGADVFWQGDSPLTVAVLRYLFGDDNQVEQDAAKALNLFLDSFEDDYVKAWQTFRADTSYAAEQVVESAQQDFVDTFTQYAHNSAFYDSLSTEMRSVFDNALKEAFSGMNWNGDVVAQGYGFIETTIQIFQENKDKLQDALQDIFDFQTSETFDRDNQEQAHQLLGLIDIYEQLFKTVFGRDLTADEKQSLLAPVLSQVKQAQEDTADAQAQVESFYEAIHKAREQADYDAKKEGGFIAEMNTLKELAEGGHWMSIIGMFEFMKTNNPTEFDDITKRYSFSTE